MCCTKLKDGNSSSNQKKSIINIKYPFVTNEVLQKGKILIYFKISVHNKYADKIANQALNKGLNSMNQSCIIHDIFNKTNVFYGRNTDAVKNHSNEKEKYDTDRSFIRSDNWGIYKNSNHKNQHVTRD